MNLNDRAHTNESFKGGVLALIKELNEGEKMLRNKVM